MHLKALVVTKKPRSVLYTEFQTVRCEVNKRLFFVYYLLVIFSTYLRGTRAVGCGLCYMFVCLCIAGENRLVNCSQIQRLCFA